MKISSVSLRMENFLSKGSPRIATASSGLIFKATRSQISGTVQAPLARTSTFRNSMRRFSNHLSLEPFGGDFGVLLVIGEAALKRSDFFVKSADLGENLIERGLVGVGTEGVAG